MEKIPVDSLGITNKKTCGIKTHLEKYHRLKWGVIWIFVRALRSWLMLCMHILIVWHNSPSQWIWYAWNDACNFIIDACKCANEWSDFRTTWILFFEKGQVELGFGIPMSIDFLMCQWNLDFKMLSSQRMNLHSLVSDFHMNPCE